jgi:hypothetical protein
MLLGASILRTRSALGHPTQHPRLRPLFASVALCVSFFAGALSVTGAIVMRTRGRSSWRPPVFGLLLTVSAIAYGVASGTTGGEREGGGIVGLAYLGVLKRPELDLRGAGLMLFIALFAYGVPALIRRLPWWAAGRWIDSLGQPRTRPLRSTPVNHCPQMESQAPLAAGTSPAPPRFGSRWRRLSAILGAGTAMIEMV